MVSRSGRGRGVLRSALVFATTMGLVAIYVFLSPPAQAAGTWKYTSADHLSIEIDWSTDNGQNAQYEVFTLTQPVTDAQCGPGNPGQIGQPDGNPNQFECHGTPGGKATAKTNIAMACKDKITNKDSFNGTSYDDQTPITPSNNCGGPPPPAPCKVTGMGWFEPVQGPYQDDNPLTNPIFADMATKQIKEVGATGGALDAYVAELVMIKNRDTVLLGPQRVVGEEPKDGEPDSRKAIVIKGETNCPLVDAKMKFTLTQGATTTDIYTSKILDKAPNACATQPLDKMQPFRVTLPAPKGIPPDKTFTFPSAGDYMVRDELLDANDSSLCLHVDVTGKAVTTRGPTTLFVAFSSQTPKPESLGQVTKTLADESAATIPDIYPIPPKSLKTIFGLPENFAKDEKVQATNWAAWAKKLWPKTPADVSAAARLEAVNQLFTTIAQLSKGVERVFVMMDDKTFDQVIGLKFKSKNKTTGEEKILDPHQVIASFTASNKVMVGNESHPRAFIVAHELAHTLEYLWPPADQQKQCGVHYHDKITHTAHAFQLTDHGDNAPKLRKFHDGELSIMEDSKGQWMDQCTYWHLAKVLQAIPDPPAILVRGRVAQRGSKAIGQLFPAYHFADAPVQLAAGSGGTWAIVLRDGSGTVIGRYPFNPQFALPDTPLVEPLRYFAYKVPDSPNVASIELDGPGGVLDKKVLSAHAPTVTITSPSDGATVTPTNNTVNVSWTGADQDGDPLVYSVLYSSDGGQTFIAQSVDQTSTSLTIPIQGHDHQVEVLVSDGTQSSSALVHFTT